MPTRKMNTKSRLFRVTCPDSLMLGEYQLGLLAESAQQQIQQHLETCPHCRQELRQLANYLPDPVLDHTPGISQRLKIWLAEKIPAGGGFTPEPAFALRGDDAGTEPLFYQAGDTQLTLEIQEDPEHPGYKTILGLLLSAQMENMAAQLWQEGRPLACKEVDDLGNFIFDNLAPGPYEIIITGPDVEIHVQDLSI